MRRYVIPLVVFGLFFTAVSAAIFLWIPPINGWIITSFLITGGLALAAWGALGIYYLRLTWGPKDSPRFILRRSLRQAFFLSLAAIGFLLLQLFGATNVVTIVLVLGLVVLMERLT